MAHIKLKDGSIKMEERRTTTAARLSSILLIHTIQYVVNRTTPVNVDIRFAPNARHS